MTLAARSLAVLFVALGLVLAGVGQQAVAVDVSMDGHAEHMDGDCAEHGVAHAIAHGGHCCVSAPMGVPVLASLVENLAPARATLTRPGDDQAARAPTFGFFRPPRRV